MWIVSGLGMKPGGRVRWVRTDYAVASGCARQRLPSDATKRSAKILHKVVTAENYIDVGGLW